MNGFNPLEGLKNRHIVIAIVLGACGAGTIIYGIVKGITWIFNQIPCFI